MVSTTLTTMAGRRIATDLKDLPPLKKGFVRLTHWTNRDIANSIVEHGLYGNKGLGGTTVLHDEEGFWESLTSAGYELQEGVLNNITRYGNEMIVMDMPAKEYRKLFITDGCYKVKGEKFFDWKGYELVCPSKYIVGVIEKKFPWGKKCVELFRHIAQKNPEVEVPKTDLRMFNGRRKASENPFAHHYQETPLSPEEEAAIEKEFDELFNDNSKSVSNGNDKDVFADYDWDF